MGRWFGYRRNYEDLPRMWVTKELKKQFRTLATVEEQIRSEIIRYEEEKLIPIQVPVKVRKTKGLAITALNKRYYTKSLKMSYSGQRPQTILFKTDTEWLRRNLQATRSLLSACVEEGYRTDYLENRVIIHDVPVSLVREFLDKNSGYQFDERNSELSRDTVDGYIERRNAVDELTSWNIAVISRREKILGEIDLGLPRKVNLIGRSKLRAHASDETTVNIGVLTNQVDWVADLDVDGGSSFEVLTAVKAIRNASGRAVLLLYPLSPGIHRRRRRNEPTMRKWRWTWAKTSSVWFHRLSRGNHCAGRRR